MTIDADALRTIHRLHRQLCDLRERLARGPKQIKAGDARLAQLNKELDAAKEVHTRTLMTLKDKELSLKQRENNILDVRARLNSCGSNKEYQAFVEQIAADEQANSVLADEIIELLDRASSDEEVVNGAKQAVTDGEAELTKIKTRVDGERSNLESEVARVENDLQQAEVALPAEVKPDYERVVKAHGDEALAPIDEDCCGGCYQKITPQMLNELSLSQIVFCKSCGRMLYIPEDTKVG